MASPYKDEFIKAAQLEIDALVAKGMWEEDLKANATTRIIAGTWIFKIKRTPDGCFKKAKARWCLRGDQMEDTG